MEDFQVREEHWVIADLIGKGQHIRTVPVPVGAKRAAEEWPATAKINQGALFRRVGRPGKIWGEGLTPKAVWHIVRGCERWWHREFRSARLAPYLLHDYAT